MITTLTAGASGSEQLCGALSRLLVDIEQRQGEIMNVSSARQLPGSSRRSRGLLPVLLAVALVMTLALPLDPASAQDQPEGENSQDQQFAPRQAIVMPHPGEKARAERAIRRHGGLILRYSEASRLFLVETPGRAPEWVQDVRRDEDIRAVDLNHVFKSDATTPDDPSFGELWGMQKIGAPVAWDVSTGSDNVVVGVIDTGIDYTHPDLAANMWVNPGEIPGNRVDDDSNGFIDDIHGADCWDYDGDPMDPNGHGTHVAGTIGAVGNNRTGVTGVNWNISLMALRFLNSSGYGYEYDAINCLYYAIQEGADVTNNSYGGSGGTFMDGAVRDAAAADQLFVAAAGNSRQNIDEKPVYPASIDEPNVITVASTTSYDSLSYFSNYGPETVEIAAPGSGIYSTLPGGGYGYASGTSMASPHVAGAAALIRAAYPSLSYLELSQRLYAATEVVEALEGKVATGRLDVGRAAIMQMPTTLELTRAKATPSSFSPNADGIKDTSNISFRVNMPADWRITIYEKGLTGENVPVRTYEGTTNYARTVTRVWDGTNGLGVPLSESFHDIKIEAWTATSGTLTAMTQATIDRTAPMITDVDAKDITSATATFVWTTNEPANSMVELGTTSGSTYPWLLDQEMRTQHSMTAAWLQSDTTYFYRVVSTDGAGNTTRSIEGSFKTAPMKIVVSFSINRSYSQGKNHIKEMTAGITNENRTMGFGGRVDVSILSGTCPGTGSALATYSGESALNFTFKTRVAATYCAVGKGTLSSGEEVTGSIEFTMP